MEEIKLDVQVRSQIGTRKIKKLRGENFIPAIVYGEGKAPTPIKVDRRSFEGIMRHHRGESVIFHLNVFEGEKKLRDYSAIVREEQHEPVSYRLTHIDFNRISLDKEIEVKVPVETKGDAVGVKQDGGSLEHLVWDLDIICLPRNIPAKLEVEVSHLKIGDAVYVKDIALPSGVRTKHDLNSVVATVVPPMKEEQVAAEPTVLAEPEVIKAKKDKEGAAAAPAAAGAPAKPEAKPDDKAKK